MSGPFSVEQANRMLPLVQRIVRDVVDGYAAWRRAVHLFEAAASQHRPDVAMDPLRSLEANVHRLAAEVESCLTELRALGVDFKGFDQGLVDFPGEIDGRPVCLCWKLGEDAVMYWHTPEDGYAGRQPLAAASATT